MQTADQTAPTGIILAPRQPLRAALYSVLWLGGGQIYNKQLERAVLIWIWAAILLGLGAGLLVLGILGAAIPQPAWRPPLGDWVADHPTPVFLVWMLAWAALWGFGVRNAWTSAERINRGEIVIRYPLRRQMVHVLASQLLGLIPFIGLLFPPAVVAEAIDAARAKRRPEARTLAREGGQAFLEWALTRIALYALWALGGIWIILWLVRLAMSAQLGGGGVR